ncbi:hypothetical protein FOVSG1_007961 [Fusarium oxysporum f. sp. vasinfectum]
MADGRFLSWFLRPFTHTYTGVLTEPHQGLDNISHPSATHREADVHPHVHRGTQALLLHSQSHRAEDVIQKSRVTHRHGKIELPSSPSIWRVRVLPQEERRQKLNL